MKASFSSTLLLLACAAAPAAAQAPNTAASDTVTNIISMPTVQETGFLGLKVTDIAESSAFYEAIGMIAELRSESPKESRVMLKVPPGMAGPALILIADKSHKGRYSDAGPLDRIGYNVKDLDGLCKRAVTLGSKPCTVSVMGKTRFAYVHDPDGNRVRVMETIR
jgi:hypothetical protein